jgi:hypothetical protein
MQCQGWIFISLQDHSTIFVPDRDEDSWQKTWHWCCLLEPVSRDLFVCAFASRHTVESTILPGFYVDADASEVALWLLVH